MNKLTKPAIIICLILGAVVLLNLFSEQTIYQPPQNEITYSAFLKHITRGNLSSVQIQNEKVIARLRDGKYISTYMSDKSYTVEQLVKHNVEIKALPKNSELATLLEILLSWMPFFIFVYILWKFVCQPLLNIQTTLQRLEEKARQ